MTLTDKMKIVAEFVQRKAQHAEQFQIFKSTLIAVAAEPKNSFAYQEHRDIDNGLQLVLAGFTLHIEMMPPVLDLQNKTIMSDGEIRFSKRTVDLNGEISLKHVTSAFVDMLGNMKFDSSNSQALYTPKEVNGAALALSSAFVNCIEAAKEANLQAAA